MILRGLQHFPPLTVLQMRRQTQRGYSTSPKSQSSLTTEPAAELLTIICSPYLPRRIPLASGFAQGSPSPRFAGPGFTRDTAALCCLPWHKMESGGPHSSCSALPNLSEHISCAPSQLANYLLQLKSVRCG